MKHHLRLLRRFAPDEDESRLRGRRAGIENLHESKQEAQEWDKEQEVTKETNATIAKRSWGPESLALLENE